MAPANPAPESTKRVTRPSTRSRTLEAHADAKARQRPVKPKGVDRVNKHRGNSIRRAQGAKSGSKSKPESKQEGPIKAENQNPEPDTSSPTPKNVTIFTFNSEFVKKPIVCHQYAPSNTPPSSPSHNQPPFIFTHGAGGTLSAPAVLNFCNGFSLTSTSPLLAFQGSMNLGARVKGFHACHAHAYGDEANTVVFGGRSMGARAAVIAATELHTQVQEQQRGQETGVEAKLVLVSYPLQGPKDVRDQILLDLPEGFEVLFIVGDRDAMCPLELLDEVRAKMRGKSRVVVVRGADHGMDVRPKSQTREVGEETGRVAARWLSGEIESEGEVLNVGDEE